MGEQAPVRRIAQRNATAYEIESVALQLFLARGFGAVTADQIAEAAGVSVRTFYRYFPDGKDGVMLLETRRGVDLFGEELRARPAHEPAHVAVREAALASIRRVDDGDEPGAPFGLAEARQLFDQIASTNSRLVATMIGVRELLLDELVDLIALRMSVDARTDVRPRLMVHAANAAITASWFTMRENPMLDRSALLADALDELDRGFAVDSLVTTVPTSTSRHITQ